MARLDFKLPDIGEGVAEGEIVEWFVRAGDTVSEDDPMVEVMTDKATVEVPSPADGVILDILSAEGETVPVGQVIFKLTTIGAAVGAAASLEPVALAASAAPRETARAPAPPRRDKVLAVPSARRVARELEPHG